MMVRVEPLVPVRRREPFDHPQWLFDVKYDGFRALCHVERGRGHFMSRNGNGFRRFDALSTQVATELGVDEAVLDGELIAADETGRPRFWDLLRGTRVPAYVAFDLLWLGGIDLRPLPLSERRTALRELLAKASPVLSEAVAWRCSRTGSADRLDAPLQG